MRHELNRRLDALEERAGTDLQPWHRIVVDVGQSEADAIAAYGADNGPIAGSNLVLRQLIESPAWGA
jgi:hypothetical protein